MLALMLRHGAIYHKVSAILASRFACFAACRAAAECVITSPTLREADDTNNTGMMPTNDFYCILPSQAMITAGCS